MIAREITSFRGMIQKSTPVFLTGGGLAMQKGCIPFFEKTLGRKTYAANKREA